MGSPTSTRTVAAIAAAASMLAVAGAPAGGSSATESPRAAAATKTVRVADDFYAPKRLKVAKGTRIKWVWSSRNSNPHDVYSNERPEGAPHFHSRPRTAPFSFTRKLRKPGRYEVLCTVHEDMRMRIDVTR